jgi:ATP-dependent RNA helicase RhlE
VEAIGLVCNFDVPGQAEDYVHRVGRTGRANTTGDAFTLVSPDEEKTLRSIEQRLGKRLPRKTVPGFNYEGISARKAIPVFKHEGNSARRNSRPMYS